MLCNRREVVTEREGFVWRTVFGFLSPLLPPMNSWTQNMHY